MPKNTPEPLTETEKAAVIKGMELLHMARHFFRMNAAGGIVLAIASILALIVANTPLFDTYNDLLNYVQFRIGFDDVHGHFDYEIKKSILLWINDGLMAVFFFLIGLEIKRELTEGGLSSARRAILPAIAAIGGMAVPALVYWYINQDTPQNLYGWAIPAATDIAFALGVLSLLGNRVPIQLKIMLTAIAIIDDIGAILIIGLFYSAGISFSPLYFALVALLVLFTLNYKGVCKRSPYILAGIVLWIAVLESGIHATLAGVITALFIPLRNKKDPDHSPCKELEHDLHPWVAFGILPIFAFANAGVPFKGMGLESLAEPLTLGIILGLFVGKQLGIFTLLFMAIKSRLFQMPEGLTWRHLYAMSILCGIGFTMSLFIGGLAFDGLEYQASLRLGVLAGSILSALAGFAILYFAPPAKQKGQTGP